jgi:hypothetical protein
MTRPRLRRQGRRGWATTDALLELDRPFGGISASEREIIPVCWSSCRRASRSTGRDRSGSRTSSSVAGLATPPRRCRRGPRSLEERRPALDSAPSRCSRSAWIALACRRRASVIRAVLDCG